LAVPATWVALRLSGTAEAAESFLYVNTYGGSYTEAEDAVFYKPFTAKTGIQVKPVTPISFAKLKAQVRSGTYEWDITNMGPSELLQAMQDGLTEPIDFTIIDRNSLAPDAIVGNGVKSISSGLALVYRKDKFPSGGPQSWTDFWDVKKFPGNRALHNRSYTALSYALLADGVPIDKLYPMDVDRAFKKLDEIKPYIKVWWSQGGQADQLIRDGETDMQAMYTARAFALVDQGVPLQVVWNGAERVQSFWFVPKGDPRAALAWRFVDFTTQPKPQAEICTRMAYGPSNPKAFDLISPEQVSRMPTGPAQLKVTFENDAKWLAPRLDQLNERWAQWLAS
jgi:putative spermidine/putrescine transport system substrate-binding protein